jgi:serine/threonine protein phosphatase PrpC
MLDEQMGTSDVKHYLVQYTALKCHKKSLANPIDISFDEIEDIPHYVSCTACVCLVTNEKVFCANAGDSKAILLKEGILDKLSREHTIASEEESARVINADESVYQQISTKDGVGLSRGLGGLSYKLNEDLAVNDQIISWIPEVDFRKFKGENDFLIIASRGLWNYVSEEYAVCFLQKCFKNLEGFCDSPYKISAIIEELLMHIKQKASNDSISGEAASLNGLTFEDITWTVVTFKRDK